MRPPQRHGRPKPSIGAIQAAIDMGRDRKPVARTRMARGVHQLGAFETRSASELCVRDVLTPHLRPGAKAVAKDGLGAELRHVERYRGRGEEHVGEDEGASGSEHARGLEKEGPAGGEVEDGLDAQDSIEARVADR